MSDEPVGLRVGDVDVHLLNDGTFVARPTYFGAHIPPTARPDVFDRDGAAWLPIGSFLIRLAGRVVLVDAGLGPAQEQLPDGMLLIGGQLMAGLRGVGVHPGDITDVICTHLHADHVGWLFDRHSEPGFPGATFCVGEGDVDHFVDGVGAMADHIREGFRRHRDGDRIRLLRDDTLIAPGVTARMAPGHTPGSLWVEVAAATERLLLLGDAITCPVQLSEPGWHSFGDTDPVAAERSRQRLWRELEVSGVVGVGAHFPQLRPGRVRDHRWTPV